MGVNKFKHYHIGNVFANGKCQGGVYTTKTHSYSSYVITQYWTVTLEVFEATAFDGVVTLPFGKSSDKQCAWDVDVGAYYTDDRLVRFQWFSNLERSEQPSCQQSNFFSVLSEVKIGRFC